jgi:hypothetical protein
VQIFESPSIEAFPFKMRLAMQEGWNGSESKETEEAAVAEAKTA